MAVVVPIFNVEKYVEEMLNGLLKQTFENFIIFLIDDGSTDNSLSIINNFSRNDSRIHVIKKENGGPGSARNAGLDYIERAGFVFDYIWFCDADDRVDENVIETVVDAMDRKKADYALISVKKFDKVNQICHKASIKKETILNNNDIVRQYFRFGMRWRKEPCSEAFLNNKFFRYHLIKRYRFREDIYRSEDFDYFVKIIPLLERGVLIPDIFYWYRLRKSSLTNALTKTGDLKVCLEHYPTLKIRSRIEQIAMQHKLIRSFYLEVCAAWTYKDKDTINKIQSEFAEFNFLYPFQKSDYKILFFLKYATKLIPIFMMIREYTKRNRTIDNFYD